MATITTSRGDVFQIDDEDFSEISRHRWHTSNTKGNLYALRWCPDGHISLHRQVTNATTGQLVDHINGDTQDCRKANLRFATWSQNARNRKRHRNTKSRYKGVCRRLSGKWQASIWENSHSKYLGQFGTEEEAARAYDTAAIALFGEFAKLNFPPPDQEKLLTFSN